MGQATPLTLKNTPNSQKQPKTVTNIEKALSTQQKPEELVIVVVEKPFRFRQPEAASMHH